VSSGDEGVRSILVRHSAQKLGEFCEAGLGSSRSAEFGEVGEGSHPKREIVAKSRRPPLLQGVCKC